MKKNNLQLCKVIQLAAILSAYVCQHVLADSMTVSETWKDNTSGGVYSSSTDTGTFNASLTVPGLSSSTANDWSNLVVTVNSGGLQLGNFSDNMADAPNSGGTVSATSATFYYQLQDTNGNSVNAFKLTFSKSGSTFTIAGQTVNPAAVQPPWSILAENFDDSTGLSTFPFTDPASCEVVLQNSVAGTNYADVVRTIFISGTNTISYDTNGYELNNIRLSGAADFTPPTLTAVLPTGTLTTTNALLTVQVRATDSVGVANVEFYLNGMDYGSGVPGVSSLWSMNFALPPGTNVIRTRAIDAAGNYSSANNLSVTYADKQTTANLITYSEQWLDSEQTNSLGVLFSASQDVGTLNAAWLIPGLQGFTANTWSNLMLSVAFGNLNFSGSLMMANVLTSSNAVFYVNTISDPNNNLVTDDYLSVARSGNTLVLAYETGNPSYADRSPLWANEYLGLNGAVQAAQLFGLSLQDGLTQNIYTNISKTVAISGTDTVTDDAFGNELNNVQISGAANFTPPMLTPVSPAVPLTTTNDLLTVQVRATDSVGVANVEFYLNGSDYGSGVPGVSNLWSMNFALLSGTNVIRAQATDVNGNNSATNILVTYVNQQTTANLITYSEQWLDSEQTNSLGVLFSASQDVGTLNAAWLIPGLKSFSANTWSNLMLSVAFGNLNFSGSLMTANVLTSSNAVFYVNTISDPNNNLVTDDYLSVARSGNTLVLACETGNPSYANNNAFLADFFANDLPGFYGPVHGPQPFFLSLQDGLTQDIYTNVSKTVFFAGTDVVTAAANGNELHNVQISGAANFTPPTLTPVSPARALTTTNDLLAVQVRATDSVGVTNVEFYLNGSDYGSGVPGVSNLWSLNFALQPGLNTIQAQAADAAGNSSTTNLLVTYVNQQTTANLITFSEQWLDSAQTDSLGDLFASSQDVGTLNAAWLIPGLQGFSANTWSNLMLAVTFGTINFSGSLTTADVLTASNAVFYLNTISDPNNNPVTDEYLSVTRSGNTLVLAYETGNPSYAQNNSILAADYLGFSGYVGDTQSFALGLRDGLTQTIYTNIAKTVYITGINTVASGANGNALHNVQISGAANFTPPTLTPVSPARALTTTNALLAVQVAAYGDQVTNVEFYVNGQDYGPGGLIDWYLWSQNLALQPGINVIQARATDINNNNSALDTLSVTYVNRQTNANLITFSEHWLDSGPMEMYAPGLDVHQDAGTLNVAWLVPGLQGFSANTWSNLVLSLAFGSLNFDVSLAQANVLTSSNAVFYLNTVYDANNSPVTDESLSVARSGDTLVLAYETGNPSYAQNNAILANNYLGRSGLVRDAQTFGLSLQDGLTQHSYTNFSQMVYLTGTDAVTNDTYGNELDDVQIAGAADFITPTLTPVSPAGTLTTTNALLTVQVAATDSFGVANVEFFINGLDYGSGVAGASNMWSLDFALQPGLNFIQTLATDVGGHLSATNGLAVTYVNQQTTANLITFSEQWLDSAQTNLYGQVSDARQDVGTLNAAWLIPGLQGFTANTWSNLVLSVAFGNLSFSDSLLDANVLSSSNAIFYLNLISDPNNNPLTDEYLSVTRSGNTLVLAYETGNPSYAPVNPFLANEYLGLGGLVQGVPSFGLSLQDGFTQNIYTNVSEMLFIAGTDTVTTDALGNVLNNVQIAGAATLVPPSLTDASPTGSLTTTNDLFTVQVKASFGVTNVEFYLNGSDYGFGEPGVSNLWSMNFALLPGRNTIWTQAADVNGNLSPTNAIAVTYVDAQTNANLITYAEQQLTGTQLNIYGDSAAVTLDTGTLNAALRVPGLQSMSVNTWSNLLLTVSFGNVAFSSSLAQANALTSSNAMFYLHTDYDPNNNPVTDVHLSVARSGNTLVLAYETGNPFYAGTTSINPVDYFGYYGAFQAQLPFALSLQDGLTQNIYTNIYKAVFLTGTNTIAYDGWGNQLDHIQMAGAADYTTPALTTVSSAGGTITTSNDLFTLQVRATDSFGVANVEFYLNGTDYGSGAPGVSNLWSLNFALLPGTNVFWTQATDVAGNHSATNTLSVIYVDRQTNASLITFSEQWLDSEQTNSLGELFAFGQDLGTLNAALPVPGLKNFTANTWSNLVLSVSFGNLDFSDSLSDADILSSSNATFYLDTVYDANNNAVTDEHLSVARSGNTLVLAYETGNPSYADSISLLANEYVSLDGLVRDGQPFYLSVQDGFTQNYYTNFSQMVFIAGTDTVTYGAAGDELDNVQVAGAASFAPPALTTVSPAGTLTTTNALLTVQVAAAGNPAVTNVEFYLNGADYGSGMPGGSNLWSQNFALLPGTNVIRTQATDLSGTRSAFNNLTVTYINKQTNASLITFAEHWLESEQTDSSGDLFYSSQDVGTLNAALLVPGLNNFTANTWSNLVLSGSFANAWFSNRLANANVLTTTSAVFYVNTAYDANDNPVTDTYFSVTRSGNTLVLAAEIGNPTYAEPNSMIADNYLGSGGPVQTVAPCALTLQDGITLTNYASFSQTMYVSGSNTFTFDSLGYLLNNVQVAGFASFIPPTLTVVYPAAGAVLTNGLVTVQVRATNVVSMGNVEFYLNNQDFGGGSLGNSNLWTMNFALAAGANNFRMVATDTLGNNPATNALQLVYLNQQTNANLITFQEQWLDTSWLFGWYTVSQDTALLNAALTVSNLQTMSANTWSNLSLSLAFGNFSVAHSLSDANVLTTNQAVFYFANPDDQNVPPATAGQLTLSRAGNTLLVAASLGNPTYLSPENVNFLADSYLGVAGLIQDRQLFALTLQDGSSLKYYANVSRPVSVTGSDIITYGSLNNVQIAGAVDFIPPTNTITAPTANQQWSNFLFTVTGTARDNVAVSTVWYALNGGVWTNAVSANNWTNWSALVTLAPGVNSLKAYAEDTSGNLSPTNAVSFTYIVSGQLQLRTLGLGTYAPNYSNAWLQIGKNYSITSAPASGFTFSGWTVSTNWLGGVVSNSTVLQFNMASNLTLLATFTETNRPLLTLTAPAAGQKMTNALATLVGTASDIWKVAGVWYQWNSNAWSLVATANGYTNWTQTVALAAGTNVLKAYAQNLGGVCSITNTVSVVSSNTFKLQLSFNSKPLTGGGLNLNLQLSPGLNGHILVSSNLLNWDAFTNFVGTNTSLTIHDPAATNATYRFYRAVTP